MIPASPASRLVAVAKAEIGTTERPAGSNRTKYGAFTGMDGQPWCDSFVSWVAAQAGLGDIIPKSAYVPGRLAAARAAGQVVHTPRPGDLACMFFDGDDVPDHIGVVAEVRGTTVVCVEGNTSPGNHGSQANGGGVYLRVRPASLIRAYIRPPYPAQTVEDDMTLEELAGWDVSSLVGLKPKSLNFQTLIARVYSATVQHPLTVDSLAAALAKRLPAGAVQDPRLLAAQLAEDLAARLTD